LETALGVEPDAEVAGMFASYGLGGIVAGVLLYMMYKLAQRVMDAQSRREEWERESWGKIHDSINRLIVVSERHAGAVYSMAESVGRLPCSSDDVANEVKKLNQVARSIEAK